MLHDDFWKREKMEFWNMDADTGTLLFFLHLVSSFSWLNNLLIYYICCRSLMFFLVVAGGIHWELQRIFWSCDWCGCSSVFNASEWSYSWALSWGSYHWWRRKIYLLHLDSRLKPFLVWICWDLCCGSCILINIPFNVSTLIIKYWSYFGLFWAYFHCPSPDLIQSDGWDPWECWSRPI